MSEVVDKLLELATVLEEIATACSGVDRDVALQALTLVHDRIESSPSEDGDEAPPAPRRRTPRQSAGAKGPKARGLKPAAEVKVELEVLRKRARKAAPETTKAETPAPPPKGIGRLSAMLANTTGRKVTRQSSEQVVAWVAKHQGTEKATAREYASKNGYELQTAHNRFSYAKQKGLIIPDPAQLGRYMLATAQAAA